MRGIGAAARRGASQFPSSYAAAFSSFSGVGGGGAGRGRGRGSGSGTGPSQFGQQPRAPGRPIPDDDGGGADPFSTPASVGRGRGEPVAPYSSSPPSFSALSGAGRGRGSPPAVEDAPKQRVTKRTEDDAPTADPERPRPDAFPSALPRPAPTTGAGRGAPRFQQPSAGTATEENRFVRRREAKQAAAPSSAPSTQPKLSAQDAVKRALELLGGGEGEDGGRGEGGRGDRGRGGGRGGRGGRSGRDRRRVDRTGDEADGRHMIYLGENADAEKLEKRLGADKMKVLEKAFDEAADNALPHPMEDAYMDACHTNNMIEFEPEYHVNFENPDIDEKAPMSLEEMLQKVKPFIVAYEGIKDQEEWEEAVKDVMKRAPHMKELIDMYSGPDVVTAKQQEEELQRVANTLPENIPSSVNRFTDKMLLSLKNNPGWGFDKKCQFMDKFAREVSELYK